MTQKIKILRIINRFNIGGPTFNACFLSRFISDDFETKLIGGVPDEGEKDSLHILEEYGVTPVVIPELQRNPNLKSDRLAYKKIKEIIREYQPDIVHTHASKAGALGRKAAYACGVKTIVHTYHGHVFHSYFGKIKTEVIKGIERNLAKKTHKIIAISPLQKQELSETHKIASKDKFACIPLGFDLEKFQVNRDSNRAEIRQEFNINDGEIAVAIVGRLAPIKNHNFFLDVIEQTLASTSKKIKVFIVGDGSEYNEVMARSQFINSKHGNTIVLTSWIKDIAKFNCGMDIMCLTSNNEGTPVSLIEAQASMLPVISTDVGGVRDIVEDDKTGFIIDKGDIETYVEKLRLLLEKDDLRLEMGKNGYPNVKDKFHFTRLVSDTETLYKSLLKEKDA